MAAAHVEGALGRLVLEHEHHVDRERIWNTARETVASAAAKSGPAGADIPPRTAAFANPGDPLAILVPLSAAAMDVAAIGAAVTGLFGRLPGAPRTARAAAAVINYQPRVVSLLESRLGRVGTDIVLNASTAVTYGLSHSPGTPLLDLAQRGLQITEAVAHRRMWRQREPELASPNQPQAPVVPVISSAGPVR